MIKEWYARHRRGTAVTALALSVLLSVVFVVRPDLAGIVGVLAAWSGVVLVAAASNWEAVEKRGGRLIGLIGYFSSTAERVGLSAEMQGAINGARRELQDELPDVMPYPARVKFVRRPDELCALKDGEVVISLKNPGKKAENTARATLTYVTAATIRPARPYVSKPVMSGVDYSITKRVLRKADRHALDFFLTEMWEPALANEPELRDICHEVEKIERKGLLTRVLLAEFLELGRRLYGEFPPPTVHAETREFVAHMARLADKAPDEDVDLDFRRGNLKVGVVLVGERDRAAREGARPYVGRCITDIRSGCDSIYLLARGARCDLVREVVSQLENHGRVLNIDLAEYLVHMDTGPVEAVSARLSVDQKGYSPSSAITPTVGDSSGQGAELPVQSAVTSSNPQTR